MMNNAKKKLLFVLRKAPYGNSLAKEALDAVLATSVYEQDLSVIFMDDGIFQLLSTQNTDGIEEKNISRLLAAFPLYDINQLFVCAASLQARGIKKEHIAEGVKPLETHAIKQLFTEQDHLLSF